MVTLLHFESDHQDRLLFQPVLQYSLFATKMTEFAAVPAIDAPSQMEDDSPARIPVDSKSSKVR